MLSLLGTNGLMPVAQKLSVLSSILRNWVCVSLKRGKQTLWLCARKQELLGQSLMSYLVMKRSKLLALLESTRQRHN